MNLRQIYIGLNFIIACALFPGIQFAAAAETLGSPQRDVDVLYQQINKDFSDFFNHEFDQDFIHMTTDPFQEMQKLRDVWASRLPKGLPKSLLDEQFSNWSLDKFGNLNIGYKVEQLDQGNVKSVKIIFDKNYDATGIDVMVGSLLITLEGKTQIEETVEDPKQGSTHKSMAYSYFKRQFPIPHGADVSKYEIVRNKNVIMVKFPKK